MAAEEFNVNDLRCCCYDDCLIVCFVVCYNNCITAGLFMSLSLCLFVSLGTWYFLIEVCLVALASVPWLHSTGEMQLK